MDRQSATPSNVIKATAHLNEVKDGLEKDKKISDVIEMLKGLVDRFERMEEKVDCRLREMEEKVDMLISSVAKAEADNMSVDESSSYSDEEPAQKYSEANIWAPIKATTSNIPSGPFVRGPRGPTSLNVGGRFSGGRCGGLGECSFC
ncbi:hypothetical protein Rs2_41870 [Raphanus sativus]|uniref:Uncharacterized protein LOC130499417 n=1 Tax=Raphanus sativus TaxID=3726 RepID=A0A9W3CD49_RAPSA|nr:uncharacterized protein LOC130499417 [Raphanus sativus]KAJ4876852.1 hypothetical protein Rs2_41870 [Raphanus sativus]